MAISRVALAKITLATVNTRQQPPKPVASDLLKTSEVRKTVKRLSVICKYCVAV